MSMYRKFLEQAIKPKPQETMWRWVKPALRPWTFHFRCSHREFSTEPKGLTTSHCTRYCHWKAKERWPGHQRPMLMSQNVVSKLQHIIVHGWGNTPCFFNMIDEYWTWIDKQTVHDWMLTDIYWWSKGFISKNCNAISLRLKPLVL